MKAYALYYDGGLVGVITHPERHSDIMKIADMLSPNEGLASYQTVEIPDEFLKGVPQDAPDTEN
jgi:hypothetical protein